MDEINDTKTPLDLFVNCFANNNGHCEILIEKLCAVRPCPFFKTQETLNAEHIATRTRLYKLYGIEDI